MELRPDTSEMEMAFAQPLAPEWSRSPQAAERSSVSGCPLPRLVQPQWSRSRKAAETVDMLRYALGTVTPQWSRSLKTAEMQCLRLSIAEVRSAAIEPQPEGCGDWFFSGYRFVASWPQWSRSPKAAEG